MCQVVSAWKEFGGVYDATELPALYDHSHVTDHYLPILQTNTCCMLSWLGIPFFGMRDWEQLHAAVGPKNGAWCNWWPDMYFLSKHIVLGRLLV